MIQLSGFIAVVCVLSSVAAVPTPNAGPDQVVTIPHDGTATTFVHNTLLNGSAIDPNGDPLKHWWSCPTKTAVDVGCITNKLQLNNYAGANGHPFISYNHTCEPTYDGNHDGGARPFGGQQITQNTTEVTSSDIVTRVLLPAGVHNCTLTSTDSYGATASDTVQITVNLEPNMFPVAHAGPDQNVTVPHDTDHTAGATPHHIVINGRDGLPEHDYKRHPSGYSGQLTAHTQYVQVYLNGSRSYDSDGDPLRYRWHCPGSHTNTSDSIVAIWLSADAKDGKKYHEQSNSYTCCDGDTGGSDIGCPNDGGTPSKCELHCDDETNCKSVGAEVCSKLSDCKLISISSDKTQVTLKDGFPDCTSDGTELQCTKPPKVEKTKWVHRCNLTVEDTYGLTHESHVDYIINTEPNHVPISNAGPDQDVTVPHDGDPDTDIVLVTLDGSSSTDGDSDRLEYFWSCQIQGGSDYAFGTGWVTTLPLKGPTSGTQLNVCTLKVTDTYGTFSTDAVTILTRAEPNNAPVVDVGSNQAYTIPHDGDPATNTVMVTLPGYASTDTENYMSPDGKVLLVTKDDVLTYLWECPTANVVSTDATTVVPMIEGTHSCKLTVTDTYGASFPATGQAHNSVDIVVSAEPNNAPVVDVGSNQIYTIPHDGDPATNTVMVTLPGYATTDTENYMSPDGKVLLVTKDDVLTYLWECPTANVVSTDATTVVPMLGQVLLNGDSNVDTVHVCKLTVTDAYGASFPATGQADKSVTITIKAEPNNPPVPHAGPDQDHTVPHDGRTFTNTVFVILNATQTTDWENYMSPDGTQLLIRKFDKLDYQWNCPTAGVASSDMITVVAMLAGTHVCTVTVTDPYSNRTDTATIVVHPEPNMGF